MDNDSYLLLLLSDGNLPTGSFVSSSGLESYFAHGFPVLLTSIPSTIPPKISATLTFIRESLAAYARIALPFATATHILVESLSSTGETNSLQRLRALDRQYEAMTLNHVARRASKAQGVALLTLFSKGFSRPAWMDVLESKLSHTSSNLGSSSSSASGFQDSIQQKKYESLVDAYKLTIRKGVSPGHLPVCWGVLTSCLQLSKERSQHLFLFLYARSLLSASIRLNAIGPYASQQILLHVVHKMVDNEVARCATLRVPETISSGRDEGKMKGAREEEWEKWEAEDLPATTWPLGEILAARHDLQHSRIFNS